MRLNPNDKAPDMMVNSETRERLLSAADKTFWTLVIFWKTTCSTCETSFPYLENLNAWYSDLVECVAVVQDVDARQGTEVARRWGATFEVVADAPPYPISFAYDQITTPTMFLVRNATRHVETVLEACIKADLNGLAAIIAESGRQYAREIAPSDDGHPAWTPG